MDKKSMTDMARTPAEMKPNASMGIVSSSAKYGYGTCITLDADALKKLGIKDLPEVGDEYHIMAIGKVTSVSKNASETSGSSRVEIQLTHLDLTHEDEAEEAGETPDIERKETFGGNKGVSFK